MQIFKVNTRTVSESPVTVSELGGDRRSDQQKKEEEQGAHESKIKSNNYINSIPKNTIPGY